MENSENKSPSIRFPEFKEAWKHKKLNELLREANKRNTSLKFGKDEVLSVSGELGIINQIEHLGRSYAGESVHNYHVVETNDIVYTKSPLKANPYGIIRLNKGKPGIVSTLYAVYCVKSENAVGEFLDFYFSLDANTNRYLRPLVKKGAKNDMKINNSYVLVDKIFVPELPEQQKIAEFFTAVDEKIKKLAKKRELLEQYKKGVVQKIFNQEIRFKDNNGNDFADWEEKKLGDFTFWASGGTPSKDVNAYWNGDIPWISASSMRGTRYADSDLRLTKEGLEKSSKLAQKGTLLILVRGSMLFNKIPVGIVTRDVAFNQDVKSIKCNEESTSEFILYWFVSIENKLLNMVCGTGIGAGKLELQELKEMPILLPSKPEQQKIIDFLSAIDDKINLVNRQLEKTKEYKKGLLQQMFV